MRLVTVDVFDTVITRRVGAPEAVFLLVGKALTKRGLLEASAETFARVRQASELELGASLEDGDVSVDQIYRSLAESYGVIPLDGWAVAEQIELDVERGLITEIPGARDLVDSLRRMTPQTLVFVSDTPLSSRWIRDRLSALALVIDGEPVVVSSEEKATKRSGALFSQLASRYGIRAGQALHVGNDVSGELSSARMAGWRTMLRADANTNRFERLMEEYKWTTEGVSSLLAGASRLARLKTQSTDTHLTAIGEIAAGVAAPALVSFLSWVAERAEESGLQRLYFVSRDGETLLKMAQALGDFLQLDGVELRYLYGGRHAWHLAAFSEEDAPSRSWIFERARGLSLRGLLARVGLDVEDVRGSLRGVDAYRRPDAPIGDALEEVHDALTESEPLWGLVAERSKDRREVALRYLLQEGLGDPLPYGVVDIGWAGRAARSLSALLKQLSAQPSAFLFFGLDHRAKHEAPRPSSAFLADERRGEVLPPGCPAMIEAFCTGSHGPVLGYAEERDGQVRPILASEGNPRAEAWGLSELRASLTRFSNELEIAWTMVGKELGRVPTGTLRPMVRDLLAEISSRPGKEVARAWASFPQDEDQLGTDQERVLAPPLLMRDLALRAIGRDGSPRNERPYGSFWFKGSLAAAKLPTRMVHRLGSSVFHVLRGLRR